jgi:hypothetical protein
MRLTELRRNKAFSPVNRMAVHAFGENNQTKGNLLQAGGRPQERITMQPELLKLESRKPEILPVRTLKIEADGAVRNGHIKPKIRLMGKWLEDAGFKPGHRVQVACTEPGVMELRFCDVFAASTSVAPALPLSWSVP